MEVYTGAGLVLWILMPNSPSVVTPPTTLQFRVSLIIMGIDNGYLFIDIPIFVSNWNGDFWLTLHTYVPKINLKISFFFFLPIFQLATSVFIRVNEKNGTVQ